MVVMMMTSVDNEQEMQKCKELGKESNIYESDSF